MYPSIPTAAAVLPTLIVDIKGVSKIVSLSTRKIYELVAAGAFVPPIRIGTSARWSLKAIEAWIEDQSRMATKPKLVAEPQPIPPGPPRKGRPTRIEIEAAQALGISVGHMRAQQRATVAKGLRNA